MAELMAMDANLPLDFSASFDSDSENAMANRAVISYVSQDMGGAPPFAKRMQTGRVSLGNQPPKARNGASPSVKSSLASRHLAAATAHDPGMVRRADRVVGGRLLRWAVYTTTHIRRRGFTLRGFVNKLVFTTDSHAEFCPLYQSVNPSLDYFCGVTCSRQLKHIN